MGRTRCLRCSRGALNWSVKIRPSGAAAFDGFLFPHPPARRQAETTLTGIGGESLRWHAKDCGLSVVAGALSLFPGGLGTTEAVMVPLLVVFGTDREITLAAALICRAATRWLAILIGMLAMAHLHGKPTAVASPVQRGV